MRGSLPVVGLTPDAGETEAGPGRPKVARLELKQAYVDAVREAGGLPVVLPFAGAAGAAEALALCDALVVTGGAFDVPPELYGERPSERLGPLKPERTGWELALLSRALARDLPVLGICGGMQLMAVAAGGTLVQDIAAELPSALEHEQSFDPSRPAHGVRIAEGTRLSAIAAAGELQVNTTHHQSVRDPGRARISAVAPDGVIEAIELPGRFVIGVQWHPELLAGEGRLALYRALVEAAR